MTITAPAKVIEGQDVVVDGKVITHPVYGQQFQGQTLVHYVPNKAEGILAFLSSGLVKGVGKKYAGLIVEAFGDDTLKVIEKEPHRLEGVKGIGKKRAQKIVKTVLEQRSYMSLLGHLKPLGVGNAVAMKLFKEFGPNAAHIAKSTPYRTTSIPGIGFRTADLLARAVGLSIDSPERIRAGSLYILDERCQIGGHTWLKLDEWVRSTHELLAERLDAPGSLSTDLVSQFLATDEELHHTVEIEHHNDVAYVAPRRLRHYEELIAAAIEMRADADVGSAVAFPPGMEDFLSPSQKAGVRGILSSNFSILTGGPGTGKTTTVKSILRAFQQSKKPDGTPWRIELAATTGKAAKKAEEATGVSAKTVHRLFGFGQREGDQGGRGWLHDKNNPLPADLVVIDEASMLDTYLTSITLNGLAPQTKLILVGDVDQLPSVGPGKVLRDLVNSGRVFVARLTEIHRQQEGSSIISVAHQINSGQLPQLASYQPSEISAGSDLFHIDARFIPQEAPENILQSIVDLAHRSLLDFTSKDIQILSPMRKGPIGVEALNKALQPILNPAFLESDPESLLKLGVYQASVGDRVMQTRNDYTNMIFNGDTGHIVDVDNEDGWVDIDFDDQIVRLNTHSDLAYLDLAYAQTVHKSQGSEYPLVIMPTSTSHYIMLSRENLYTGVTRAKKYLFLVGTTKALGIAVRRINENTRNTALPVRISAAFA